jgi:hypothetical protein
MQPIGEARLAPDRRRIPTATTPANTSPVAGGQNVDSDFLPAEPPACGDHIPADKFTWNEGGIVWLNGPLAPPKEEIERIRQLQRDREAAVSLPGVGDGKSR